MKEIRKFVPPEMWNYVNTNDNSRGCQASKLKESELWFHGLKFLTESSELWPKDFAFRNEIPGLAAKWFKRGSSAVCETNVNLAVTEPNVEAVINCEKLSDANKLLRITSLVLRFIHKLKGKLCKTKTEYDDCLTSEEINSAEKLWIKHVQKTLFHEKTFTQTKVNLGLFVDDEGILRCSGRIQYSSLPYDSKFPMLLPNGHYFTKLIIAKSHEQVSHNKVQETLTQLRSRFWVIKVEKL